MPEGGQRFGGREVQPQAAFFISKQNMKHCLLVTMVLILVLCILAIVISPYIDLPLTTLRTCLAAVLFAQVFLLGCALKGTTLFSVATKTPLSEPLRSDPSRTSCRPPGNFLPWLCVYLC